MKKRHAVAGVWMMAAVLAAGCAPGQISEYARRAQQAGEIAFEGETAAAFNEEIAQVEERQIPGGTEEEQGGAAGSVAAADAEVGAAAGGNVEAAADAESEADSLASSGRALGEPETEAVPEGDRGEGPDAVESEAVPAAQWPEMMRQVPDRAKEAWEEKRESFSGRLAGADRLNGTEQAAISAVLARKPYDGRTLCFQASARYDGGAYGSFLIFFDSAGITAQGRVKGDLWYYGNGGAALLLEDAVFLRAETISEGGNSWFAIHTQEGEETGARLYRVQEGACSSCFEDAASVFATEDGICVMRPSQYFQYDPVSGEWSKGQGTTPGYYFYDPESQDFLPYPVRALTAEEYLDYIRPGASGEDGSSFLQEQKDLFFDASRKDGEYDYAFFAVGDSRIGYRERRIGGASPDGSGDVAAQYRFAVYELDGGRLTPESGKKSGEGYWFGNPEDPEDELAALDDIPADLLEYRIAQASDSLRSGEREALERVRREEAYPADGLAFVETADYDRDGKEEAFVAAGRYDGAFGAPVCDLWYVTEEGAQLLEEARPVRGVSRYELRTASLYLMKGYGTGGSADLLYCVWEGAARRLLEEARSVEVEENGDLTAWKAGEETLPSYSFYSEGTAQEYPARSASLEEIREFENGQAVYDSLLGRGADSISCIRQDNGLWHMVLKMDDGAASYETWEERDGFLILIDCGEGSVSLQEEGGQGE